MIQLFVTLKGHNVGRFQLDKSEVRLGRNPENEVVLNNMAISRHHCTLKRGADGTWKAKDLSNNGTFLNGHRIAGETAVKDGDALGLGQFQVLIKTSGDLDPDALADVSRPELLELDAPLKGYLTRTGMVGNEVMIEQDVLQVGSARDVDLRVEGPAKLALIVRGYGGIQLVNVAPDQDALVQVAGVDVADRRWLHDGDALRLGELHLTFHEGSPTGGEQTVQIHINALKLTPPAGLPEASPADTAPPPPPPPPPA